MESTLKNSFLKNTVPKDIIFLNNITNDSYSRYWFIDIFIIFKSINNILYLIFTNRNKSIISYNIIDNKRINEIKNAHENYISSFRYYLDNINKRDLIISISSNDLNIKLWNIINFELILNIKNIYNEPCLESACLFNNNSQNYIITCNAKYEDDKEPIKVFDFKGNQIKEINDSYDYAFYIDIYYDNYLSKNYIITGNIDYAKSYDYNENKLYHKYCDNKINNDVDHSHFSIIMNKKKEVIELIGSSCDGNIRIWNFHSSLLLNKIKVSNRILREICLWNKEYLFAGCDDKKIKLIDLNSGKIIKELKAHKDKVLSIKTIIHPKYGECLISQGAGNSSIKLWAIKI